MSTFEADKYNDVENSLQITDKGFTYETKSPYFKIECTDKKGKYITTDLFEPELIEEIISSRYGRASR